MVEDYEPPAFGVQKSHSVWLTQEQEFEITEMLEQVELE
jgi:hypothetical protein